MNRVVQMLLQAEEPQRSQTYFHCKSRPCERTWVFVVAGCGLSDRAGRTTGVEITSLFAWAAAVICFNELYKSWAAVGWGWIKEWWQQKERWSERGWKILEQQNQLTKVKWLLTCSSSQNSVIILQQKHFVFGHTLWVPLFCGPLDSLNPSMQNKQHFNSIGSHWTGNKPQCLFTIKLTTMSVWVGQFRSDHCVYCRLV